MTHSADNDARCSCGNRLGGDNLCMPSACQWEGIEPAPPAENDARCQSSYRVPVVGLVRCLLAPHGPEHRHFYDYPGQSDRFWLWGDAESVIPPGQGNADA